MLKRVMYLDKAARTIVTQCMGVKKNETVLIVTDTNKKKIADSIFRQAKKIAKDTI